MKEEEAQGHQIVLRNCPVSLAHLEGHRYSLPGRQAKFIVEDWDTKDKLISVIFVPAARYEKGPGGRAEIYEPRACATRERATPTRKASGSGNSRRESAKTRPRDQRQPARSGR